MDTITIEPRTQLFREEIIPRTEKAITVLTDMTTRAEGANKLRLERKIEAIQKALDDQRERFENVKNAEEILILVRMIQLNAEFMELDEAGTALITG